MSYSIPDSYDESSLVTNWWSSSIIEILEIEEFSKAISSFSEKVKDLVKDENSWYPQLSKYQEQYKTLLEEVSTKLNIDKNHITYLENKESPKSIKIAIWELKSLIAVYEVTSQISDILWPKAIEIFRWWYPWFILSILLDDPDTLKKLTSEQIDLYSQYRWI